MTEASSDMGARRGAFGLPLHPGRSAALGEVHSRPAPPMAPPRAAIKLVFMTDGGAVVDHATLSELCRQQGVASPDRSARHHAMSWGKGSLRWERHTECSTWTFEGPAANSTGGQTDNHPFGAAFPPPGSLICGMRLQLHPHTQDLEPLLAHFDPTTLCASRSVGGAIVATDFRQDADGLTRFLVIDNGLSPARAGALAQRLFDIEMYRTLALLGLPLAQSLSPRLRATEDKLTDITRRMRDAAGPDSHAILDELISLAAELEADSAASFYRFGASRAYDDIVHDRLEALEEQPLAGYETFAAFLDRRMAPAMRTCRSVEERQINLSAKLARTATLLRTRVDVDVERQNRDLLASMNRRAKLQLRLQQTVEGLSVAAVSYYVVGLFGYLAKGLQLERFGIKPEYLTAAFVPVALFGVWWLVRRIRRGHAEDE